MPSIITRRITGKYEWWKLGKRAKIVYYCFLSTATCLVFLLLWRSKDNPIFDLEGRAQDDPKLIQFIRDRMNIPSPDLQPYNLQHPEKKDFSTNGQGSVLKEIFGNKTEGFFIEVGAWLGETFSPTLYWEREMNWSGLLIEPHPQFYRWMTTRNRRAITLQAGLSPQNTAHRFTFKDKGYGTKIVHLNDSARANKTDRYFTAPCFPIMSILAAIGNRKIDLFSLDVEGVELKVLRTLDLSAVDIYLFLVEFQLITEFYKELQTYMEENGYFMYAKLHQDVIFVKNNVKLKQTS